MRVRPCPNSVWATADTVIYCTQKQEARYVYNRVHPVAATNAALFQCVEPLVKAVFDGQNVTVMAYGQTGSGKTHSMFGTKSDPGVVPRAAKQLIALCTNGSASLNASCVEIYNESARDLMAAEKSEITLRDAETGTQYDRTATPIKTYSDYLVMSSLADNKRKYGVTDLNEHSSRSHIIFTFEVTRKTETGEHTSVLHLVDLAGSECASKANTEGSQLREGGFINKSLLALGNVVDAIVEGRSHIPYRESKLTRILRSCVGGFGLTLIVGCVNPSRDNFDQTVATLRFTQRAMKIKTDPTVTLLQMPLFGYALAAEMEAKAAMITVHRDAQFEKGLEEAYKYCHESIGQTCRHVLDQTESTVKELDDFQLVITARERRDGLLKIKQLQDDVDAEVLRCENSHRMHDREAKKKIEEDAARDARNEKLTELKGERDESKQKLEEGTAATRIALENAHGGYSDLIIVEEQEARDRLRMRYQCGAVLVPVADQFAAELLRMVCSTQHTSTLSDVAAVMGACTAIEREIADLQMGVDMVCHDNEQVASSMMLPDPVETVPDLPAKIESLQQQEIEAHEAFVAEKPHVSLSATAGDGSTSRKPHSIKAPVSRPRSKRTRSDAAEPASAEELGGVTVYVEKQAATAESTTATPPPQKRAGRGTSSRTRVVAPEPLKKPVSCGATAATPPSKSRSNVRTRSDEKGASSASASVATKSVSVREATTVSPLKKPRTQAVISAPRTPTKLVARAAAVTPSPKPKRPVTAGGTRAAPALPSPGGRPPLPTPPTCAEALRTQLKRFMLPTTASTARATTPSPMRRSSSSARSNGSASVPRKQSNGGTPLPSTPLPADVKKGRRPAAPLTSKNVNAAGLATEQKKASRKTKRSEDSSDEPIDVSEVIGIAARRRLENVPPRPNAEKAIAAMQISAMLARATPVKAAPKPKPKAKRSTKRAVAA